MSYRQFGNFVSTKFRPIVFRGWIGALLYLFVTITSARGAESDPKIDSVVVGFRGLVEVGRWCPIRIHVSGKPGTSVTPRVISCDVEGRPVRQAGKAVVLQEGITSIQMVYQHGPLGSPVRVELVEGEQVLAESSVPPGGENSRLETIPQSTDFVVCLGDPLLGFDVAAQQAAEVRKSRPDRIAPLVVQHYSPDQFGELPLDPRGWESIDVCVLSSNCEVSDAVGRLLKEWVYRGGRLLLNGGENVMSVKGAGLAGWLPMKLTEVLTFRDVTSLSAAIPGSSTLRLREGSLRGGHWVAEAGRILAPCLDGPIVVRSGADLGTVTAIAFDLNAAPFARDVGEERTLAWDSLPDLCRWLAGLPLIPPLEEGSQRPQSDLNPTGVSDLQTQLVNTLDRFPDVSRPSYWMVLGTVLLFLTIAGPLDYLLVHRIMQRPHWTWMTLPIWIGLGTLTGLSAAARTSGSQDLTRQLDLVTWDSVSQDVQLDSWFTIYGSRHHRYAVTCEPGELARGASPQTAMRWAGRPEAGFRGLYRESGIGSGAPLEISPEGTSIPALPVRQGASVVLETRSQGNAASPVIAELYDNGDGHLRGTFSHQLSGDVVDWVLAYQSFAYLPVHEDSGVDAPLVAGKTIRAEQIPSRLLVDYLVRLGTRSVMREDRKSSDFSISRQLYDPLSRDLHALLRTTTFYGVVEGPTYTGLTNSTLQRMDLTRLVDSNRAILFGRLRNSAYQDSEMPVTESSSTREPLAAQYSIDGQPVSPRYRECYVRWILPVRQSAEPKSSP